MPKLFRLGIPPLLTFLCCSLALAQAPHQPLLSFNGAVKTVVEHAGITYIGGEFTRVGRYTGFATVLNTGSGDVINDVPLIDGPVYAVVPDGAGGWYVGGDFLHVDGEPRSRLAHIYGDFSLDPFFTPTASDEVRTLALAGGTLFVGGRFSEINGVTQAYLGSVDAFDGASINWQPVVDGAVLALERTGTTLYIGGEFATVDAADTPALGAVSTLTGRDVDGFKPQLAHNIVTNPLVNTLALAGDTLYIGGDFDETGGVERVNLAAVDGITGTPTDWYPGVTNEPVYDLLIDQDLLYAAGQFDTVAGVTRNYLAAISLVDAHVLSWDTSLDVDGPARTLSLAGDQLFVAGGDTLNVNGPRRYVTALNTRTRETAWQQFFNGPVHAMDAGSLDNGVFAAGAFNTMTPVIHDTMAAMDAETGTLLDWQAPAVEEAYDIVFDGDRIYVAGFTEVVALDKSTGTLLWSIDTNGRVNSLFLHDRLLYMGGNFTQIDDDNTVLYLAAFDVDARQLSPWRPGTDGEVFDLVVYDETVYVAGAFATIAGENQARLAAVSAADGGFIDWRPTVEDGVVTVLAVDADALYFSGSFTTVNNTARSGLAAIDLPGTELRPWTITQFGNNVLATNQTHLFTGGFQNADSNDYVVGSIDALTGNNTPWQPQIRPEDLLWDRDQWLTTGVFLTGQFMHTAAAVIPSAHWANLPIERYTHVLYAFKLNPPVTTADLDAGLYAGEQIVTLDCDPVEAIACDRIYYTLDGTDPGMNAFQYSGPITIGKSTELRFFAVNAYGHNETLQSVQYTIDGDAPVTTADPEGGRFDQAQTVTLNCSDATSDCDRIFYTIDGVEPDVNAAVYAGPITVDTSTTLKFFATDTAGNSEAVQTMTFTITEQDTAANDNNGNTNGGGGGGGNMHGFTVLLLTVLLGWQRRRALRKA